MLTPKRIAPPWCFLGTGQVLTLSTFYGLADIPSADRTWPRNKTLVLKNWHFLGLILRLNFLSLSNTSWIQSNISSMVGAKMQMSSRYSNKVTNCWSPKHCSIKQQKLEPAFESPNGIQVNSYRPIEPALNAVFFMSLSCIASWRYPWARSKDENQLLLWTACRASSILGNGNVSLLHLIGQTFERYIASARPCNQPKGYPESP